MSFTGGFFGSVNPTSLGGVTGVFASPNQGPIGVTGCFYTGMGLGDPREDYTDEAKRAGNCDKCVHRLKSLCGDFCNEADWHCITSPKELVDPNMGDIEDEV